VSDTVLRDPTTGQYSGSLGSGPPVIPGGVPADEGDCQETGVGDMNLRFLYKAGHALGTGMPNQSPSNVAASFLVELGNGESFLFDMGTGSTDRLAGLEVDYSSLDKVFASHLHTDHIGDIAALWVGGWLGGRYTPLHVYGPSGSSPELGIKVHIDHIREAWAWDVSSRTKRRIRSFVWHWGLGHS